MLNKAELEMAAEIVDGILQTDAWGHVERTDPCVKHAEDNWDKMLQRIEKVVPREVYVDLSDAHTGVVAAHADIGILYGLHVATVMREAVANPVALTRHWLKLQKAME